MRCKAESSTVEYEVAKLRRFVRLLALGLASLMSLWIGSVVLPVTANPAFAQGLAPKEVRAMKFVVEDAAGNPRAIWTVEKIGPVLQLLDRSGQPRADLVLLDGAGGEPQFHLYDKSGTIRYSALLLGGCPGVTLSHDAGMPRSMLMVRPDGSPELALWDADGERVALGMKKGSPSLRIWDRDRKAGLTLGVLEGHPLLDFADRNEKSRVGLALLDEGGQLSLLDANGKPRAMFGTIGNPGVMITDETGRPRASLMVPETGPTLSLNDESGRMRTVLSVPETARSGAPKPAHPDPSIQIFGPDGRVDWSSPK